MALEVLQARQVRAAETRAARAPPGEREAAEQSALVVRLVVRVRWEVRAVPRVCLAAVALAARCSI